MAVDVGSAVGYLDLDISGFLSGLKEAQGEADKQSKNMATVMGNNISGVGKGLSSVGSTLTKSVTVPLLGIGAAGLKVATDFEKGMSEVKAISGATGKDFDALREKAIELGATTAFSAGEVAEAMTEMAKAGWSSQQIIDGMGGVLDATAASGESLGTVATIVADAITGFGLEAKDSTKVADLLTQAANSGTIGITELGESFKYIAPVAGALGISIEDTTTALSAMSMAGIKGSQAGTSLRTMLANLVKPSDTMQDAMIDLGLAAMDTEEGFVSFISNADGSFKSLDEIIGMIRNGMAGMTEEQKASTAAALAGKEGMSGLLAIMNLSEEEYNAIAASMDNANGVAKETAEVMQDNLQSKVEQLGGALESLAIKLADHVIPYIQQFVEWLTRLVDKFTALDPETQKFILKVAGIAVVAGPVIGILGKMTTGVGGLVTAFGKFSGGFKAVVAGGKAGTGILAKLGGAIAGISAPVVAVVAVVGVLVAAFTTLWKTNEEFRNKIEEIWDEIKETFNKLTSGIVERLNSLGFDFKNMGEVLKAIWKGFCDLLAPYFAGVFQFVADTFNTIVNVILGTLDFFIALFSGNWEGAWNAIKGIFESVWNGMVAWFTNIGNTLTGILDVVCGWFGTTWSETWESIKTFFVDTWNAISTWFQEALNNVTTFFTNTWTSISTFFQDIWNGITSFLTTAWETIKNVVQVGIMFVAELIGAAFQLITLPFRFIWENCKETIMSAWESIKSTVSENLTTVKTVISNAWNAVKTFFTETWTSISTSASAAWNGIKNAIATVVNAIKTVITNVWNGIKTVVTSVVNGIKTAVTNAFNAIKTTATNIWNNIKTAIEGPMNTAKTTISNVINNIKSIISSGFNSAKSTVTSVFNSIKSTIADVMSSAKNTISGAIDKIKGYFDFDWSLPKLKMPHPKISGEFSLNPPSVPSFSIEWYKKAMGSGMILTSPTIFGFDPVSGKFLGGGEAGSETVVGTGSLINMIRQSVNEAIQPIVSVMYELAKSSAELGYVTYNGFTRIKEKVESESRSGGSNNSSSTGDVFVFNSPKAIDEVEAARQMKKAKRELAEGF